MNVVKSGLIAAFLAATVDVGTMGAAAAVAQGLTSSETSSAATLLAQAPTPFCRRANRSLDVYSRPSVDSDSATRATIEVDTSVFLVDRAEGGGFVVQNGFVEVIVPSANSALGYVIARHLKGCGGMPPPQEALCSRVTVPFLNVRAAASVLARTIGSVSTGQTVRIVGDSPGSVQGQRVWANIEFGNTTGWIAETAASGEPRNLSDRFPCPQ